MNTLNTIVPFSLVFGGLISLAFAFSRPVSLLPRWVRNSYLLLAVGMGGWGVVNYIHFHREPSISDGTLSLILQAKGWFSGFSTAIVIVLMMSGAFPRLFGRSGDIDTPFR